MEAILNVEVMAVSNVQEKNNLLFHGGKITSVNFSCTLCELVLSRLPPCFRLEAMLPHLQERANNILLHLLKKISATVIGAFSTCFQYNNTKNDRIVIERTGIRIFLLLFTSHCTSSLR